MNPIDQILAVKTRLTTVKGYAQLIEREMRRPGLRSDRLMLHVTELNQEIDHLIALIAVIEDRVTGGEGTMPQVGDSASPVQPPSGG